MKMGIATGSFDIIHPGYILMFKEAKKHCDYLIILLHEDPTVEGRDWKIKPILNLEERILILDSIKYIDEIIPYKYEKDIVDFLTHNKIDIRFVGNDYKDQSITGKELPITLYYIDRSHGWSTTKFKKLIAKTL